MLCILFPESSRRTEPSDPCNVTKFCYVKCTIVIFSKIFKLIRENKVLPFCMRVCERAQTHTSVWVRARSCACMHAGKLEQANDRPAKKTTNARAHTHEHTRARATGFRCTHRSCVVIVLSRRRRCSRASKRRMATTRRPARSHRSGRETTRTK